MHTHILQKIKLEAVYVCMNVCMYVCKYAHIHTHVLQNY
jgi:hypothetical protein